MINDGESVQRSICLIQAHAMWARDPETFKKNWIPRTRAAMATPRETTGSGIVEECGEVACRGSVEREREGA